jgi:16S rRNA (adenine1518-N6/adenine1519-N6)-dimethyltransferase
METFKFKKKYGQNFLTDENIVKKIVNDIEPKKRSLVIEIGPGDGRLNKYLCEKFDKVIAYEIDEELKENLSNNLKNFSNYDIYFSDFMKRDIVNDLRKEKYNNLYVIANLPYYITTPILEKIISLDLDVSIIRVMVQKEVGDRFSAIPGSRDYGSITAFLNYNFDVKKEFVVSRNSFYPKPNVDSMVVSLYKKDKIFVKDLDSFYNLMRDSFKFKRKTLKNNLKGYDLVVIEKVLKKYDLDLSVRAESLPVEVFCDISNNL